MPRKLPKTHQTPELSFSNTTSSQLSFSNTTAGPPARPLSQSLPITHTSVTIPLAATPQPQPHPQVLGALETKSPTIKSRDLSLPVCTSIFFAAGQYNHQPCLSLWEHSGVAEQAPSLRPQDSAQALAQKRQYQVQPPNQLWSTGHGDLQRVL